MRSVNEQSLRSQPFYAIIVIFVSSMENAQPYDLFQADLFQGPKCNVLWSLNTAIFFHSSATGHGSECSVSPARSSSPGRAGDTGRLSLCLRKITHATSVGLPHNADTSNDGCSCFGSSHSCHPPK